MEGQCVLRVNSPFHHARTAGRVGPVAKHGGNGMRGMCQSRKIYPHLHSSFSPFFPVKLP